MVTNDELKRIVEEINNRLAVDLCDGSREVVVIEEKPLENIYSPDFFYFLNGKAVVSKDALNNMYPYMNYFEVELCLYDHTRNRLTKRGMIKG
jgi:hypothetical protein